MAKNIAIPADIQAALKNTHMGILKLQEPAAAWQKTRRHSRMETSKINKNPQETFNLKSLAVIFFV